MQNSIWIVLIQSSYELTLERPSWSLSAQPYYYHTGLLYLFQCCHPSPDSTTSLIWAWRERSLLVSSRISLYERRNLQGVCGKNRFWKHSCSRANAQMNWEWSDRVYVIIFWCLGLKQVLVATAYNR